MLDVFKPLFAKKNLYLIRWVEVGWLNMYGRKPLIVPSDAAGYRLRSQASEASQIFMTSLKGDMLQMSFQDLIPSLQTGLVEGGETGVLIYGVTGLSKEAPNLTLTRHAYDTGIIVANYKWFMSLPKETQAIIESAFPTSNETRAGVRGMTNFLLDKIKNDSSVTVHALTPEDRAKWVMATRDNHKKIIKDVGGQSAMIYEEMIRGRAAYRTSQGLKDD